MHISFAYLAVSSPSYPGSLLLRRNLEQEAPADNTGTFKILTVERDTGLVPLGF